MALPRGCGCRPSSKWLVWAFNLHSIPPYSFGGELIPRSPIFARDHREYRVSCYRGRGAMGRSCRGYLLTALCWSMWLAFSRLRSPQLHRPQILLVQSQIVRLVIIKLHFVQTAGAVHNVITVHRGNGRRSTDLLSRSSTPREMISRAECVDLSPDGPQRVFESATVRIGRSPFVRILNELSWPFGASQ